MGNCRFCGAEFNSNPSGLPGGNAVYCESCKDRLLTIEAKYTTLAPRLNGLSDGPGSGMTQVHFNRPDPYKETARALKIAEANGQLKDPKMMKAAQEKLKILKMQQPLQKKVDYDKRGGEAHPLSGDNS
jgi:hypothetical protein